MFDNKNFQKLFSFPAAGLIGLVTVGLLVFDILHERSVHLVQEHPWKEVVVTPALAEGVSYKQAVTIPEGLGDGSFLMGLFFGRSNDSCVGDIQVTLSQASFEQMQTVMGLATDQTLRKRFEFSGFKAGAAELQVTGMTGNGDSAPSLLCIVEEEGPFLEGLDQDDPITASIDWFKIMEGNQKLSRAFPNRIISLLWILPFAGFVALAWSGMNPARAE